MGHDTDERLMLEVVRDSTESLEVLMRRYGSSVLTYLQRMVGCPHLSEDLFQEVFLAVWRKRNTFRRGKPFRPWLFAIATNACRAQFRRASSLPLETTGSWENDESAAGPVEVAIATETDRFVAAAVTHLPPQQRATVVMRVWNGLDYEEIARALRCAPATVRSHMRAGLAALRRALSPRLNRP